MRLLAGRIGQVVNFQSLSDDIGVDAKTLKRWMSVLEASYVIVRLQPYYRNFGKRLVKSPKIYFADVGLAAYLLGIQNAGQVEQNPLFGNLFENMVVADRLKQRLNRGEEPNLYYYRDARQLEIDLIKEDGQSLAAFEIKSAATANERFTDGLNQLRTMSKNVKSCSVIYSGQHIADYKACTFRNYLEDDAEQS